MTECKTQQVELQRLGSRRVVLNFEGGDITSDAGGAVLVREADARIGLIDRFAECFDDRRDPVRIEHHVPELLAQRIFGNVLGYEDLNDHDELARDPALAMAVGKKDPMGEDRRRPADRGKPLASSSTLNRLELGGTEVASRNCTKKILCDFEAMREVFLQVFLDSHETPPDEIVFDFDASHSPLHGRQEGRFFHGYYNSYCYLPLYVFCGEHLLLAELRRSNIDASEGTVEWLEFLVSRIRKRWPDVRIVLRGDSGFCRDAILDWCEGSDVYYIVGIAKNGRLLDEIQPAMDRAQAEFDEQEGTEPIRHLVDFTYRTLNSWSRARRVIGKAEVLPGGPNPRFVVTNMDGSPEQSYGTYCMRGECENRIKEQQLYLFGRRMSAGTMRANQIRLWLAAAAYTLVTAIRRLGLKGSPWESARCDTLRRRLFKVGALVRKTARRVWIQLSSSWPYRDDFLAVWRRLAAQPLRC